MTFPRCNIGGHEMEIEFHCIEVDATGYPKVPRSVSTIMDLSIAVMLCRDRMEDMTMIREVASKILRHSADIYVICLWIDSDDVDPNWSANILALDEQLRKDLVERKVRTESLKRLIGYSARSVGKWKRKDRRIAVVPLVEQSDLDVEVGHILGMMSRTITGYIKRLETTYKAV